jgi:hypothetical protein
MRDKLIVVGIVMVSLALLCCLPMGLFLEGSLLPNKPCRPMLYPNGERTTESRNYVVAEPIETVSNYYNRQLDARAPGSVDTGQWRREELSESTFLYSCRGVDINGLTTETGCIFVSREASSTRIKTQLWRSEGGHVPCQP